MLKRIGAAVLASGVLIVGGCGPRTPPPTVHASMKEVIAPEAQAIWDVTNHATNGAGDGLDPSKITGAEWAQLENAGRQLKTRASVLAKVRNVVVAEPGVKLQDEGAAGGSNVKAVQAYVDANRAAFSEHARKLAEAGDAVLKASKTKDVAPLFAVSSNLDQVCESCHAQFWYPPQPKPSR